MLNISMIERLELLHQSLNYVKTIEFTIDLVNKNLMKIFQIKILLMRILKS